MTDWTQGYVTDLPYSLGFYRETMPNHLAFAAVCVGSHPGCVLKPTRVLELGFGMGLGFVLGAAASPHISFEGVDFNPQHVAHAQGLIDEAGLSNVGVREASFQDVAREASEGQHDLDLIVLHGILTWVSAEAHEAIVEIARKRLKPGGMLYVSYNCMPGWAPVMPLQRLMREKAKRIAGRSDQQTGAGIELVKALITEGAGYFVSNPALEQRVEKLVGMDRNYLAHEYLNANWFIFHFADVAELFSAAKLMFVCSATLIENMDGVSIPVGVRQRIAEAEDQIWKETLRDYASNKQFRRDVFIRGQTSLTPQESETILNSMRFILAIPRDQVSFKIATGLGEIEGKSEIYSAVADLLATKVSTFAEVLALPVFSNGGRGSALQTIALLVNGGQVLPIASSDSIDIEPAQRLNRWIIRCMLQGRPYRFLAAPLAGSAVAVSPTELLILAAVLSGRNDIEGVAEDVSVSMQRLGMSPAKDGVAVTEESARLKILCDEADIVLSKKLPVWRSLGVI